MPLSALDIPRPGYTLPVFSCAAALAALHWLQTGNSLDVVELDLVAPPIRVQITVAQVAGLAAGQALAITHSDPGDNLDLTRGMAIWALVSWAVPTQTESVSLLGGEGVGRQVETGAAAIYGYAQTLLRTNLEQQLQPGEKIQVQVIFPQGRRLAERTSNAAFGVVEGLSLLGTSGISQPLSAPTQLEVFRSELQSKALDGLPLVFCIGENGLDLSQQLAINPARLVKTANWLGPLLVAAGEQRVPGIVLLGYHGKLLKLAGGIFHTHHHLADARREILTAFAATCGLPQTELNQIFAAPTAEAALSHLRHLDTQTGFEADVMADPQVLEAPWVVRIYQRLAGEIDRRAQEYIWTHSQVKVQVGSILFDRQREIIVISKNAEALQPLVSIT